MDNQESNTSLTTKQEEAKGLNIFDLWAIVKSYIWELVKFSWLIIGIAVFGAWYLYNRKSKDPTLYEAELTFILDTESARSQQSVMKLFNGSISGDDEDINLTRLRELLITRSMSELALFSRASIGGKEDFLINHYLDLFGPKYTFTHDSTEIFTPQQNRVLLGVHSRLTRSNLRCKVSPSKIISLVFTSNSERFSKEFLENYYVQLDSFYYEKAVAKHKIILKAAEEREKELRKKLGEAESTYAKRIDQHKFYTYEDVSVQNQYYATRLSQATEQHLGAINSLEAAKATLERQSPIMQIIDPPIYPLPKFVPDARLHMLVGGIGGAAFAFFLVVARKFIGDFLRREREKMKKREEEVQPVSSQDSKLT